LEALPNGTADFRKRVERRLNPVREFVAGNSLITL